MTISFKAAATTLSIFAPYSGSVQANFDIPTSRKNGDRMVVIGSSNGTSDTTPTTYNDLWYTSNGPQVSEGATADAFVTRTDTDQWFSLFASDGMYEGTRPRLISYFSPYPQEFDYHQARALLLLFSGSDGINSGWEQGAFVAGDTSTTVTTSCAAAAPAPALWVHVLTAKGPGAGQVQVTGGQLVHESVDFRVVVGTTALTGEGVTWQTTGAPFSEVLWLTFSLAPKMETFAPSAADAAGAVGFGRYPIRAV